jgi:N-acetylmuramoyl-L-alanine amidase
LLAVCFVLLSAGLPATGWASLTVDHLRHWSGPEHTRVVLDLNGPPVFKERRAADPPLVILDIEGQAGPGTSSMAIGDGRLQSIQVEPRAEGGIRITCVLHDARAVKVFTLGARDGKPHRIVVDVLGAPSSSPPRAASAPPPAPPAASEPLVVAESSPVPAPPDTEPAGTPAAVPEGQAPVMAAAAKGAAAAESTLAAVTPPPPKRNAAPQTRPWIVVVDPGHGGEDPGARGPGGVLEKNLCLALARALTADLNKRPGIRAHLTRDEDVFLPLRRRTRIAAEKSADLFVSVHANSSRDKTARGTEVYFLSLRGASDAGAREVAMRENAADLVAGVPPAAQDEIEEILLDLMRTKTLERSSELAATVIEGLQSDKDLILRGVKQAGFDVLKTASMPSILVETAFISHSKEAKMMKSKSFQERFGKLVGGAVADYLARVGAVDQAPRGTPAAAAPPLESRPAGS